MPCDEVLESWPAGRRRCVLWRPPMQPKEDAASRGLFTLFTLQLLVYIQKSWFGFCPCRLFFSFIDDSCPLTRIVRLFAYLCIIFSTSVAFGSILWAFCLLICFFLYFRTNFIMSLWLKCQLGLFYLHLRFFLAQIYFWNSKLNIRSHRAHIFWFWATIYF